MSLTREDKIELIRLQEERLIRQERAKVIPKLAFLYQPMRYKTARGGRGSGKSWEFARALLKIGVERPIRVLCTREIQKSIKDSVHKLLSDQIVKLGFTAEYIILENEIRGTNGTSFVFSGLAQHTVDSIKSFEGIDYCWIEEAQSVSKRSWNVLLPTIRKEGSEIWVSYNPELETDETHQRFAVNPPPNCVSVHINYNDNPWFPKVLEDERLHCQATQPDDYDNIWEGICRAAVSGAIYAKEVAAATIAGRICNMPYDPGLKVHTVWDMGFGDNMVVIFVQKLRSEIRIIDYIQVRQHRTDQVGAMVNAKMYNWGYDFLPHDGFHTVRGTGMSDADILRKMGRKVKQTPNIGKEDGIRAFRNIFHQIYFDKLKANDLLECLKRYRRAETKHGGDGNPIHDEYSDGADASRYLALNLPYMTNEDEGDFAPKFQTFETLNSSMGY